MLSLWSSPFNHLKLEKKYSLFFKLVEGNFGGAGAVREKIIASNIGTITRVDSG